MPRDLRQPGVRPRGGLSGRRRAGPGGARWLAMWFLVFQSFLTYGTCDERRHFGEPDAIPAALPCVLPHGVPSIVPSAVPNAMPNALPGAVPSALHDGLPGVVPSAMPVAVDARTIIPSADDPPSPPPPHPSSSIERARTVVVVVAGGVGRVGYVQRTKWKTRLVTRSGTTKGWNLMEVRNTTRRQTCQEGVGPLVGSRGPNQEDRKTMRYQALPETGMNHEENGRPLRVAR